MNVTQAKKRFEEIADETCIFSLSSNNSEPTKNERDELWEITRIFVDKIYNLDIEEDADQDEINKLCHYSIIALHWNDLGLSDERFAYDNGRFRRDTIALAACLFCRISRDYEHYDHLKHGWILPHTNFSFLMWTLTSIIESNYDNFFQLFNKETAKKAKELFHHLSSFKGYLDVKKIPDDHPLLDIWWEIHKQFTNAQVPFKFVLNYIWGGPDIPGGLGLIPKDREMNKDYLKKQIVHKHFPNNWSFLNDLGYVYLFFAKETDGSLDDVEVQKLKHKILEWLSDGDKVDKEIKVGQIYKTSRSMLNSDNSLDRFSFVLENIRRNFVKKYDSDIEKVRHQLSFVLEDLVSIAKADGKIIKDEYDLVEKIRENWGIDRKFFDEETTIGFNSKTVKNIKPTKEHNNAKNEFLDNYPGNLYCKNSRWDNEEWGQYPINGIQPFLNVFEDEEYKYEDLFRRFSQQEVDLISKKIKSSNCLIYLPFVHKILSKKFDMRGMKAPFWFDPFIISGAGNGSGGLFYFEQNGFYQNTLNQDGSWLKEDKINCLLHVDAISSISVEKGYNNYWDNLLDGKDEDIVTTLDANWENKNSGANGFLSFVQTNGTKYASTLPIVKSIWDNAWQKVVNKSKGASAFFLGPPPFAEFFNNWDELIEWAKSESEYIPPGINESS